MVAALSTIEPIKAASGDFERANLVRDLFVRAREARRSLVGQWKQSYRVLNNRSWAPNADQWQPTAHVPLIWPVVASLVAWMTDQRPTIQATSSAVPFSPLDQLYAEAAEDMNAVLGSVLAEYQADAEINKVLWDVLTYGIGYTKTVWEPWLADGLGDTMFRRVDPFTIYPDPWARSPRELNFILQANQMTVDDLDRAFPGASKAVGEGWIEDADEAPHRLEGNLQPGGPRANLAPLSPATMSRYRRTNQRATVDSQTVTVLECWIKQHEHQRDGDVTKTTESWRVLVVCGNRVLMDEDGFDVSGHGQQPFDRMTMFDTGEWYGASLVQLLAPLQHRLNTELAALAFNIALMGNPILLEGQGAQAQGGRRVSNRPGQRVTVRNPSDVAWLNPPQIHPQAARELIAYYESKIESISGMSAIVRGFTPGGRNAQGTLDQVQDAAFVRVRATMRELERLLRSAGAKMMANVAEFYTEPRVISLIGPDGQQSARLLRSRHFYRSMNDAGDETPMRFNLQADAGSQLPTSRQARAAQAQQLFALGAIDDLELLTAMQWPNAAAVAKRVMDQQVLQGGPIGPGARQRTRA